MPDRVVVKGALFGVSMDMDSCIAVQKMAEVRENVVLEAGHLDVRDGLVQ